MAFSTLHTPCHFWDSIFRKFISVAFAPTLGFPRRKTATQLLISLSRSNDRFARAVDLLIASALLVLTFPLLALVALAIKLDGPGPVFCQQPRVGLDGRRFLMLKFRATERKPEPHSRWIGDRSTRETRVGQFLRYTRTEDLPQLVNVLRGEMSLTGCGWAWPHFFD